MLKTELNNSFFSYVPFFALIPADMNSRSWTGWSHWLIHFHNVASLKPHLFPSLNVSGCVHRLWCSPVCVCGLLRLTALSVLRLYCAAGRRHGRRHGAIVMAILQYQYPDTATKRQQPMLHHSTPLTPLLSFSLHPHQSIPPSLTKYVRIDSASAPCSLLPSLSLSL